MTTEPNPDKEDRIIIALLTMLLLVVAACSFTSCKSKHKVTEREKTEEATTKATNINKIEVADVLKETIEVHTLDELFLKQKEKLELTQADPSKTIKVTDHHGRTTTITGANATISREEQKEERETTATITASELNKTVKTENIQIDEAGKKSSRSRTSDSQTSGISPMVGLGIGIAVVIVLILLYRKYSPI